MNPDTPTPILVDPEIAPWLGSKTRVALKLLFAGLLVALLYSGIDSLRHEFHRDALIAAFHGLPSSHLLVAVVATLLSFVALAGYDWSALRYVGVRLRPKLVAITSFIAYALGNTIGLGVLTGGAVRMRLYSAAGLDAAQIAAIIAFNAVAFGLGITVTGAIALLWGAGPVSSILHLPEFVLRGLALAIILAAAIFLVVCGRGGEHTFAGRWRLRLPPLPLALGQLLISAADIALAAAVLWVLLPDEAVSFPVFAAFYAIALVAGVISHVPGGLGVFEAVMLLALGGRVGPEPLAAALLAYRAIYFLLPLMLAMILLAWLEVRRTAVAPVLRVASSLSPVLLGTFTLIVGLMLLVSGVTPATDEAAELLALRVPLPLVEASHFLGSIAGLGLLFVARGMWQRLDAAWWAGLLIALISFGLSFPKGVALSEAALLAFLVLTLIASRKQFTRRASLLAEPFSLAWWGAVSAVIVALTGLLFFVYRDVAYTDEMWWQFTFNGDAPRSLRALVGVALIALVIATRQLLRPPPPSLPNPDTETLERAAAIVRQQEAAHAGLALMGDKHLMFSESGRAFVMFGRRGRSWVSLYDPVGPQSEWPELVWRLIENARAAGGRASFYQVRPQTLPVYLDAGLRVFKLGEHAYVPLADFTLKGSRRGKLRSGVNRAEREGLSFELVPVERVPTVLAEMSGISRAWLDEQRAAEKGFSLGVFDPAYVQRQPVALARRDGQIVAFATVMTTECRFEVSVDLMRHRPGAPKGTMDFLFANLMQHYQAQGVQRFGLGMAPLSGMAEHPLAPNWHRLGRLLFSHGETFYNFQGLRAFKEKFDPQWEARYLASPGGVAPLIVLTDVAALIGGGLRGVIAK